VSRQPGNGLVDEALGIEIIVQHLNPARMLIVILL
jgi:hypothetical protein